LFLFQLDEAKKLLQQYESQTNRMHRDVAYKNQELENVRYVIKPFPWLKLRQ